MFIRRRTTRRIVNGDAVVATLREFGGTVAGGESGGGDSGGGGGSGDGVGGGGVGGGGPAPWCASAARPALPAVAVDLAAMGARDQLAMFDAATVLVATAGTGLHNVVFMRVRGWCG